MVRWSLWVLFSRLVLFPAEMMIFVLCRTSSTSVEQARERGYHRALLLSKDKDTGEPEDVSLALTELA